MAGLAAAALAAAGLVGAGTAADAAIATQPAGVSITVDATGSNTALVSSPTVANVTVKNNSASASLGAFTIVVPAGVAPVQAVGVQGPGNWRQTVLPCGATANCSALVLVYASLPLSTSVLRPGQSVTSSVRFTTPAAPTSLAFKFLGIGNGLFTTTDTPTISVIQGVAGSFCVTPPGNLVAGATASFTVQAISDGSECGNVAVKKIGIAATSLNVKFNTDDSQGGIAAGIVGGPLTGGTNLAFPLPASSTGLYTFTGTFTAAGTQSIRVATATAGGNSTGFTVSPSVANKIVVNRVAPKNPGAMSLTAGAVFTTSYEVTDAFGNVILTPFKDVSISVTGGTFTKTGTGTDPVAGGPGANPGDTIAPVDGTVDGAFDGSGPQTLTASVGTAVSSTPITVTSGGTSVTFAAASTGSAILFPGVPAVINTAPCDPTVPGTTCAESSLPNGAVGAVTFDVLSCAGVTVGVCQRATDGNNLVDLEGLFTVPAQGNTPARELYSAIDPASITLHCTATDCPPINDDGSSDDNTQHEQVPGQDQRVDDFTKYAPFAQLSSEPALAKVGPCQPASTILEYGPAIPPFSSVPGPRQVCVDVNSFVRDSVGNLSATLYYYEDFKGSMG